MRQSWDEYFMSIAQQVATRATCNRRHVGAVLVRDNQILATGYNGALPGMPHCDQVGHLMEHGHCVRTVHAEANAIAQAAKFGCSLEDASIYTTASPCWDCFRLIASAGVAAIYFLEEYGDPRLYDAAAEMGLALIQVDLRARNQPTPRTPQGEYTLTPPSPDADGSPK